ncbi:GlxA family transcriptional regulator [Aliisedimentitalea scapharcae]|uniref:GlxA family transcriptional regulator n=1 Tax=Aliisedimentitalea scapharcae TaxID=1524259 RepID=A0ABZ2XV72_9RHOB
MKQHDTMTLGFLLFPGFPMACLTSAIEPLRAANEIAGKDVFRWKLVSEDGRGVNASANVIFQPDCSLEEVEDLNVLFLMSSPQGKFSDPKASNGKLRHLARHGVIMGSASGGLFPLARSGLIEGHTCSVHWCYKAAFQAEFPSLETVDDVIVLDRRRFTASGAAAMFDLSLKLIEQTMGDAVMTEVACWFQHPLVRAEGVRQKIPAFKTDSTADSLPPPVAKAVEIFADNLEHPVSIRDIASEIGVSPRQLERSFKSATGQSPALYYRTLRMNAARQLVMYSRDSITSIANAVGYATSSTLSQHYRDSFGVTPQEERRNVNLFRVQDNRPIPSV